MIRALVCLLCFANAAQAHLMPKQTATLNILDKAAFFVVAVPVSALDGVDDDGNNLLSAEELTRHSESIKSQFESRFDVVEPKNKVELTMVLSPLGEGETGDIDYVLVMHRRNFDVEPTSITVRTSLFGKNPDEQQIKMRAKRGERSETTILSPTTETYHFFR